MLYQDAANNIVIVGGGPIGCALAGALAQAAPELNITVCDAGGELPTYSGGEYDPRVLALNEASCQFLASFGVWNEIAAQRVCPYSTMAVWDSEGSGLIEFDAAEDHTDRLGVIVENSAVVRALRQHLSGFSNVQWLGNCTVDAWLSTAWGNEVSTSNGDELSAALVIAADGAQSTLRELAHLPTRKWSYNHEAIITTVRCEQDHQLKARQWFSHAGPLAFLPLAADCNQPNSKYCSIVWSQLTEKAQYLKGLNDADFCAEITRASEAALGPVTWVDKRFSVPLEQSHAIQYGCPGLVLVGDAAHRVHPLAGQGVNLGFSDVDVLCQEVLRAHQRGVALNHSSIIARYQRKRKPHNMLAMASMEGFKRLFEATNPAAHVLRNRGMSWVGNQLAIKKRFMRAAAGKFTG